MPNSPSYTPRLFPDDDSDRCSSVSKSPNLHAGELLSSPANSEYTSADSVDSPNSELAHALKAFSKDPDVLKSPVFNRPVHVSHEEIDRQEDASLLALFAKIGEIRSEIADDYPVSPDHTVSRGTSPISRAPQPTISPQLYVPTQELDDKQLQDMVSTILNRYIFIFSNCMSLTMSYLHLCTQLNSYGSSYTAPVSTNDQTSALNTATVLMLIDNLEQRIRDLEVQQQQQEAAEKIILSPVSFQPTFSLLRVIWNFFGEIDSYPPFILGSLLKLFFIFNLLVIFSRVSVLIINTIPVVIRSHIAEYTGLIFSYFINCFAAVSNTYISWYCRDAGDFCSDLSQLVSNGTAALAVDNVTADNVLQAALIASSKVSFIFEKYFRW